MLPTSPSTSIDLPPDPDSMPMPVVVAVRLKPNAGNDPKGLRADLTQKRLTFVNANEENPDENVTRSENIFYTIRYI